jgi:hypothetical protein
MAARMFFLEPIEERRQVRGVGLQDCIVVEVPGFFDQGRFAGIVKVVDAPAVKRVNNMAGHRIPARSAFLGLKPRLSVAFSQRDGERIRVSGIVIPA